MTDPIRARLDDTIEFAMSDEAKTYASALRAVLDIHRPRDWDEEAFPIREGEERPPGPICLRCSRNCEEDYWYSYTAGWPCDTVRAIAEALGVVQ